MRSSVPHWLSPLGVEWLWKSVLTQPGVFTSRFKTAFTSTVSPAATSISRAWWLCSGPRVTVTQGDLRAIQLAKAALTAGAQLLMDRRGVEKVDRVVLAGAFGAHISPLHALVLGMIPDCPVEKVTSAGNAAGTGARIALLDRGARAEIAQVVRRIEKIETAVEPKFQAHFVDAMALPNKSMPYPELRRVVTLPDLKFETASGGGGEGRRRRRRG